MENSRLNSIKKELNNIIQNKTISQEFINHEFEDNEFVELQDAICYLSNSFEELKVFLQNICEGNIKIEPPERHNFLAGPLKELHSILKHIVWKTSQVAKGDYNQQLDHLGAFSDNFNLMVQQLKDRETKLKKNAIILEQSLKLLTSIIEVQEDWVLVSDTLTQRIIYSNKSAKDNFYNPNTNQTYCIKECSLLQTLVQTQQSDEDSQTEFFCDNCFRYILIRSFPIEWNDKSAMVHFLKDITEQKAEERHLSNLAYKDEMTGIYNRRYCIEKLHKLLDNKTSFSIVMIDIDNLKYVNDTFGHKAGDNYICSILEIIEENIRQTDIFSRIGGDEFIIILPNCSEQLATKKIENIRNQLETIKTSYHLSISYGITSVNKNNKYSIEELIEDIDKKMYAFKKKNKKINLVKED